MQNTQNRKILQIKNETLVIGVDIGKNDHYACAIDFRGLELSKRVLRFPATASGYALFDSWLQQLMINHNKSEALVGFEPTGHYWFSFGKHLKQAGHCLAIVNPHHVKKSREFDDNSPTKTDLKDPKTIAMLVKDGRYRDVYIPAGIYAELREAINERERLQEQRIALKNQVTRWLDIRFPEFSSVFCDWTGKMAYVILRELSTPSAIVAAGLNGIQDIIKKHVQQQSHKKAPLLLKAAQTSVGCSSGLQTAKQLLDNLLAQYELLSEQLQTIEMLLKKLLLQIPNASRVLEIKGIGIISAASIISEIGDINRFSHSRQLIKLAGLILCENSSGKHRGKTRISKRGRPQFRRALFRAMIPLLSKNEEFIFLHKEKTTRLHNPLKKMQSLIALCSKLLRIFYALLSKGNAYDSQKLFHKQTLLEVA